MTTTDTTTHTFRVMTIIDSACATRDLPDKPVHEAINEIVGGCFCMAFDVEGPAGRMLTGFVHDEGLLLRLRPNVAVTYPNGYTNPLLVGPMVIMATDDEGESQPLSDVEVAWLQARMQPAISYGVRVQHFDFTK